MKWRAPAAGSDDEARRILVSTIAPAALYFLLHSLHARVQGNWLAPLYPACAILAADWVARTRAAGTGGLSGIVAKGALWAAPLGLAVAGLAFAQAMTGIVPLGAADPTARIVGYRDLARELDAKARMDRAAFVLTQGYALTSLMTYYGDPSIAVVQPDQRIRWVFEPDLPPALFAAPGLALGEAGKGFQSDLKRRFRIVEPAGVLERRRAAARHSIVAMISIASPIRSPRCSIRSARGVDQASLSVTTPARMTSAARARCARNGSPSSATPISAAKMTEVSRKAATAAIGALVIAQITTA